MPSPANEQTYQGSAGGPQGSQGDSGLPRVVTPQTRLQMPKRNAGSGDIPLVDSGGGVFASAGYRTVGDLRGESDSMGMMPMSVDETPFVTRKRLHHD